MQKFYADRKDCVQGGDFKAKERLNTICFNGSRVWVHAAFRLPQVVLAPICGSIPIKVGIVQELNNKQFLGYYEMNKGRIIYG